MGARGAAHPTKMAMLIRGLTGRCAVCGTTRLTSKWIVVRAICRRCGFNVERKEGHFVGAVGMNTIVTSGAILVTLLVGAGLTAPDIPVVEMTILTVGVALAVSLFFFPISKTLWSAIDLMFVELEPGEVDPRYDPSVTFEP
jgi:uncharacterized protein (DUF983 family)